MWVRFVEVLRTVIGRILMRGWMDGRMDEDGCMDGWKGGKVEGCRGGCEWMGGGGLADGCMGG